MTKFSPVYETELGKAYCCDSLKFLPTLPAGSVDLVVTSPPYALHFKKEYGNADQRDYVQWFLKLYTYAHLRHDEDVANDVCKKAYTRISSLLFDFRQETSWIEPEILALSKEKLSEYLNAPLLKEYRVYLEKIVRLKPHTLSAEKEELLALAGNALETPSRVFGSFNNADLKFPMIEDGQ